MRQPTKTQRIESLGHLIILDDYEKGQGKIIVSGHYNSSYYWGAMGSGISEFICSIDSHYFSGKLAGELKEFNLEFAKTNLRKEIRGHLPFYIAMDDQKCLREDINNMDVESEYCFFNKISSLLEPYSELKNEIQYIDELMYLITEPWNVISTLTESREAIFYEKLHKELKTNLFKKQL